MLMEGWGRFGDMKRVEARGKRVGEDVRRTSEMIQCVMRLRRTGAAARMRPMEVRHEGD